MDLTLAHIEAERLRRKRNKIESFFPDNGPFRRELYPKHMEFFAAGALHRERLFLAGNRVGKTEAGAYEITCHMTGKYPTWWTGKRFATAQNWWIAGDTSKTVRDIQQFKLLGPPGEFGTGMIPGSLLGPTKPKQGIPDAVETFYTKHVTGEYSTGMFKSYDQRREAFQGTEMRGGIWADEELPMDIYTECLTRLMTTEGLLILTFTPLSGWTEVVDSFLKKEAA
jgi:phage terminase large subunit-like protein